MRKPIIAGNWKMYKTLSEAKQFAEEVKAFNYRILMKVDSVICAPPLFLRDIVNETVSDSTVQLVRKRCTLKTKVLLQEK